MRCRVVLSPHTTVCGDPYSPRRGSVRHVAERRRYDRLGRTNALVPRSLIALHAAPRSCACSWWPAYHMEAQGLRVWFRILAVWLALATLLLAPQASVMAAASEHRGFGAGGAGAGSGEACKGDTAGNVDTHTMSDSVLTSVDAVDSPLIAQGATQLAASIRSGDTTSVEVTRAFLARIRRVNPRVNAVVEINPSAEEVRHIQRAATPWIACGDPCVLVCTARYCPRQ